MRRRAVLVGSQWDTPAQAQSVFPSGTDVSLVPFGIVQVCIDDREVRVCPNEKRTMKGRRFTKDQIIAVLKESEADAKT